MSDNGDSYRRNEFSIADANYALAQLRHLYEQMVGGRIGLLEDAAAGLLAPGIRQYERLVGYVERLHDDLSSLSSQRDAYKCGLERYVRELVEAEGSRDKLREHVDEMVVALRSIAETADEETERRKDDEPDADYQAWLHVYDHAHMTLSDLGYRPRTSPEDE